MNVGGHTTTSKRSLRTPTLGQFLIGCTILVVVLALTPIPRSKSISAESEGLFSHRLVGRLLWGSPGSLYSLLDEDDRLLTGIKRQQFWDELAWFRSCTRGFRPTGSEIVIRPVGSRLMHSVIVLSRGNGRECAVDLLFRSTTLGPRFFSGGIVIAALQAKQMASERSNFGQRGTGAAIRTEVRKELGTVQHFGKGICADAGGRIVLLTWADLAGLQ